MATDPRTGTDMSDGMAEVTRPGMAPIKACRALFRSRPDLLALQFLSIAGVIVLFAAFVAIADRINRWPGLNLVAGAALLLALIFVFGLLAAYVVIFCNAALAWCAHRSFSGERVSVGAGLARAVACASNLSVWTLTASTKGLAMRLLAIGTGNNFTWADLFWNIAVTVLGTLAKAKAWVASRIFTLHALVVEGLDVRSATDRSARILNQRWAAAELGGSGLAKTAILYMFAVFVAWFVGFVLTLSTVDDRALGSKLINLGAGLAAVSCVTIGIMFAACFTVFVSGAYAYAITGKLPRGFDGGMMERVFGAAAEAPRVD
jgi:hypothetical protein